MTCGAVVEVNLGGPTVLNVVGARRGSRWQLPMLFSDDIDLATVTAATLVLKKWPGGDDVDATIALTVDLSQKASNLLIATATTEQTPAVAEDSYLWEIQLASTDPTLNGWAPLCGTWEVVERQAVAA